jgi:hypothetical protein
MSALQIHLFLQNKPKFRKVKLNVNKVITRDYEQMDTWSIRKNKPNSNPIQTQFKANQSQNKPNANPKQTQFQTAHCGIGILPCILCVDMAGLRRKRVTFYPGGVYNEYNVVGRVNGRKSRD